jgi:tetratricopeptide (TPR) repeat protein
MNLVLSLSTLALRKLVDGACTAVGVKEGGDVAVAVAAFLNERFTDHSQRLTAALQNANERAWKSLELSLAGESFWERCKSSVARAEDKAFARQVRAFLDATPLPEPSGNPAFRQQCLEDLRAARKEGLLTGGTFQPRQLAEQTANFVRFTDPQRLLEAEWQVVKDMAQQLKQAGKANLSWLLSQRPPQGTHILVAGVRYFFRRAVEEDQKLFQGLAFSQLERLGKQQEEGFAALAAVMTQQGQRLAELLEGVQAVVVETHSAVLNLQDQIEGQSGHLRQIGDAVQKLLEQHHLQRREVRPGDSLSIRNDGERQLVKQLVARYRALPEQERRQVPALLNAVGKLEVVAGDFDAARQDFAAVATLVEDNKAQAEAHFNAYQVCLERHDWSAALGEFIQAVKLDAKRFASFPVGKYQPQRILGAGGFGVAFLCKHKYMDAQVVVKTLMLEDLGRDADKVFTEAQVLRQLDHSAVIRISDCGYVDAASKSRPFIVMDYFQGGTLEEYVKKHGPLSVDDLLGVARSVAEGLQAAHGKGILHRDVKPANLLVRKDGASWQVKVIDFGLALRQKVVKTTMNASTARQGKTLVGESIAGTLDYAAPEQMGRRNDPVGPSSDVYGWAKTCCYALFQTTQPLLKHWQSIPQPLARLLEKCLDEDPKGRPASFKGVLEGLNGLKAAEQPAASTFAFEEVEEPKTVKHHKRSWSKSGRPLLPWLVGSGVALLAVLVLLSVTVFRVRTKVGTVVVEVDQPGAEVSVDGNRLTLTSPAEKEPVKIDVDEGSHQLKVTKGGFEAFTKQFSMKAAATETIRVRLEPVKMAKSDPPRSPKEKPVEPSKPVEPTKPEKVAKYPPSTTAYYRFEEGEGNKVVNAVDGLEEGTHNAAYRRDTPVFKIPLTREENRFGLEFQEKQVATVNSVFPFHRDENATLEFWLKVPEKDCGSLFWTSTGKDDTNRFNMYIGGGTLGLDYRSPKGERHALLDNGEDGKLTLTPNTWTHIAVTRTGTTYRFYKNGRLAHTATDNMPDLPTTTAWTIGGRPDGWPFKGTIDELRFTSKALSPEEFLNASSEKKSDNAKPTVSDTKDRRVAKKVLEVGGSVSIIVKEGAEPIEIRREIDLPEQAFWIAGISLQSNTNLYDGILVHLSGLTHVTALDLATWHDKGEISDKGLAYLSGLKTLRELQLGGTHSRITDTGLSHLKELKDLEFLGLTFTKITDKGLAHLSGLGKLKKLGLCDVDISDEGLSHLKNITQLRILLLRGTKVTDAGLLQLRPLVNLEVLWLNNTRITDKGIATLTGFAQLQTIDISNTRITDAGLQQLSRVKALKDIKLSGTKVSARGVRQLKGLLPSCKIEGP